MCGIVQQALISLYSSELAKANRTKFERHRPIIGATKVCFIFQKICFFSKPEHLKSDWVENRS